jgi:hypothetical protein
MSGYPLSAISLSFCFPNLALGVRFAIVLSCTGFSLQVDGTTTFFFIAVFFLCIEQLLSRIIITINVQLRKGR